MKHILVTGGRGFIGHHLVKELGDAGHRVTVVDNYKFMTVENQTQYLDLIDERIKYMGDHDFQCVDVADFVFDRYYDVVYHLGGYPRQHETSLAIEDAITTTGSGIGYLIKNKPSYGKLVYFSTSMVYGDFKEQSSEDVPCVPKSVYGVLRLSAEHTLRAALGDDLVVIRPSAVYGPRDSDIRVIGKMIKDITDSKTVKVNGSGVELDFTFVDDVVKPVAKLVETTPKSKVFNVTYSASKPYTLLDAAKTLIELIDKSCELLVRPKDEKFPSRSTLSNRRLKDELGYVPKHSLEIGLKKVVEWSFRYRTQQDAGVDLNLDYKKSSSQLLPPVGSSTQYILKNFLKDSSH